MLLYQNFRDIAKTTFRGKIQSYKYITKEEKLKVSHLSQKTGKKSKERIKACCKY